MQQWTAAAAPLNCTRIALLEPAGADKMTSEVRGQSVKLGREGRRGQGAVENWPVRVYVDNEFRQGLLTPVATLMRS